MENRINIDNFRQIMNLREAFASNRKTDKIEVLSFTFDRSEKLAILKQGQRVELLHVTDKYSEKNFGRKLKLIAAYSKK